MISDDDFDRLVEESIATGTWLHAPLVRDYVAGLRARQRVAGDEGAAVAEIGRLRADLRDAHSAIRAAERCGDAQWGHVACPFCTAEARPVDPLEHDKDCVIFRIGGE